MRAGSLAEVMFTSMHRKPVDVTSLGLVHVDLACCAQGDDAASDEFGPPEEVEVSVDNITTASYSLVRGQAAAIICAHAASNSSINPDPNPDPDSNPKT